jgi:hypothetical protein
MPRQIIKKKPTRTKSRDFCHFWALVGVSVLVQNVKTMKEHLINGEIKGNFVEILRNLQARSVSDGLNALEQTLRACKLVGFLLLRRFFTPSLHTAFNV